jgi:predicted nucleic acid-binding protein
VIADPPEEVPPLSGDADDDRIITAAVVGGAETLVSGDRKHVLPLGDVGPMHIMRPKDLLQAITD